MTQAVHASDRPRSPIVLVHGAMHGAWCWRKVVPLLSAAGHRVHAPTLTGLAERAHLLDDRVTLATHVADVTGLLDFEDLVDVVLVGHSYGGMILNAVAAVMPERLRHLVYLDAVVAEAGETLGDALRPEYGAAFEAVRGDRHEVPPGLTFDCDDPEDVRWVRAKLTPHPIATMREPAPAGPPTGVPATYVACMRAARPLERQHARAKGLGWQYVELAAGHDAMISAPCETAAAILAVASLPRSPR